MGLAIVESSRYYWYPAAKCIVLGMYALALLFLHKTKVEISLMKKILLKANISNAFADYRLTLQQVQVHVIYIQSPLLWVLCAYLATLGSLCTILQSVQTQG